MSRVSNTAIFVSPQMEAARNPEDEAKAMASMRLAYQAVFRVRIHRINVFLGLSDPDPLVRGMDPDPDPALDPSLIKQIWLEKP
jgi:hypothetical protein